MRGAVMHRAAPPAEAVDTDLYRVVQERLENAGATLLAMPDAGNSTAMRGGWMEVVDEYIEAYGWTSATIRPAVPSAGAISRMDEAFTWLGWIPNERQVVRRVVAARSLVSTVTGRHVFTWRRIGEKVGAHHTQVQRWHAEGLGFIVRELFAREFA